MTNQTNSPQEKKSGEASKTLQITCISITIIACLVVGYLKTFGI